MLVFLVKSREGHNRSGLEVRSIVKHHRLLRQLLQYFSYFIKELSKSILDVFKISPIPFRHNDLSS